MGISNGIFITPQEAESRFTGAFCFGEMGSWKGKAHLLILSRYNE